MTTLRRRRPGPSDLTTNPRSTLTSTSARTGPAWDSLRPLVNEFGQAADALAQVLV